ncbi:DUF3429 domain-containing protein [Marinibactrum halimedae]|uniref:DUF3429 domain-containing protein n=1 Tax=Marinibactrum halimedae TaxID=1444977 RepID=A0AA37WMX7_9GAMM|nr:DUF3429 domain-containing protein [Marinibactrum halimedae]MCD9460385.1 DUF3429 domain-containing protein [Marinibactrum halimedae]GLS26823.1 hypothetical protein GCM10007877_25420 [Marinibactrum halimedae]
MSNPLPHSSNQAHHTNFLPSQVEQLGYAGLLPFIVGAIAPWIAPDLEKLMITGFRAYSTAILSFLAGSLWYQGLEAHRASSTQDESDTSSTNQSPLSTVSASAHTTMAIVFSLWAWVSFLLPQNIGIALAALGFIVLFYWETHCSHYKYPLYIAMRQKLTWIVAASHLFCWFNSIHTI